jgi:hypothetical protein
MMMSMAGKKGSMPFGGSRRDGYCPSTARAVNRVRRLGLWRIETAGAGF